VIEHLGLFDPSLPALEDWDLWLKLSSRYSLSPIDEPLASYRVHAASMSNDVMKMQANRMRVVASNFGSEEGDLANWSAEKRKAYGFAYHEGALGAIQAGQRDLGWCLFAKGIAIWPPLLERLDSFYELACADQPRGFRGHAELLDLGFTGSDLLTRLADLFVDAAPSTILLCGKAYGNAYLALGMLNDQAGHWADARRYFLLAFRANPRLARSFALTRRLVKLCAGRRLVRLARLAIRSTARTRHSA
jgi:hypothetical protein